MAIMSLQDCVDMDCDGPKHALIRDIDGRFVSTHPSEGSIIPFAELRWVIYFFQCIAAHEVLYFT